MHRLLLSKRYPIFFLNPHYELKGDADSGKLLIFILKKKVFNVCVDYFSYLKGMQFLSFNPIMELIREEEL